ncbi:MAG: ATP synthase subunit I [Trueperaceae bacterium]|nr:ATP synthase subunit I [Trueperaceae bacterium]
MSRSPRRCWGSAAGALLGITFVVAVRWTALRLLDAPAPGRLLAVSSLVRVVLVAAGFVALARLGPLALVGTFAGFVIARGVALTILARPDAGERGTP